MQPTPARNSEAAKAAAVPPRVYYGTLFFEYVGATSLVVQSPLSGRRYRFERPGARVEIDLRDRPWLAAVPNLRQVPHQG